MLKYIVPILLIFVICSCGSKVATSEDDTSTVVGIEYTPTESSAESSTYSGSEPYNSGSVVTNPVNSSSINENTTEGDGYRYGYDMGYIAGENNMEYNPYLPNTASYPMAYRQAYCRGYDVGYKNGQQVAGRPAYHVNTGDEPEETYIEYYEYDDDDY